MRSGKLRHSIVIQQRTGAKDGAGQLLTDTSPGAWSTFFACHAEIMPLSGRELVAAQAVQSVLTHRVRLRYHASITTAMRVQYGARYFNIVSPPIITEERNREIVLMCEEGLYNG
jgi:SPP1 family predicted phage head-tail adaptor